MSLNLNTGKDKVTFKLHPVVVLSILDHYKRRNQDQTRVVGTLLGERQGRTVFIKNCFPVPHIEGDDQVAVDMDYHKNMLNLHQRVQPNEVVVGWYSTGAEVSYVSSLIHDVFKSEAEKTKGEDPVHLTVDTGLTNSALGVTAYQGKTLKVGSKSVLSKFEPVRLDLHAYEAEKIAVDALINGAPDDQALDAPATMLNDVENLDLSMNKLLDMLEAVSSYTNRVNSGEIKGDPDLGRAISNALAAVPHIDPSTFEKMFNQNIQDLLMIVYLSNLTRTQLALADKINGLLV
jgi:translation initiation factor 3 subunit F